MPSVNNNLSTNVPASSGVYMSQVSQMTNNQQLPQPITSDVKGVRFADEQPNNNSDSSNDNSGSNDNSDSNSNSSNNNGNTKDNNSDSNSNSSNDNNNQDPAESPQITVVKKG